MRRCNGISVWKHLPQVVSILNNFQEILVLSCARKCVIRMLSVFLTQRRAKFEKTRDINQDFFWCELMNFFWVRIPSNTPEVNQPT